MKSFNKLVLIVEDTKEIAKEIRCNLEKMGCDSTLAHSGEEALKKFDKEKFDLVIMNHGMYNFCGLRLCKKIKQKNSTIPVIMIAFHKRKAVKEVQSDYIIKKPVNYRNLFYIFQYKLKWKRVK